MIIINAASGKMTSRFNPWCGQYVSLGNLGLDACRLQATPLHRPAARCYCYPATPACLVAVLHIRLIRPGRPGVFV